MSTNPCFINTIVERDVWISMFNAAITGICASDTGMKSRSTTSKEKAFEAAQIADLGLQALRVHRIELGSKADDFTHNGEG